MIPYVQHGETWTRAHANAIETHLGLPLSPLVTRGGAAWDAIAHACRLPDTAELALGLDGPPILTLPADLLNAAVRIANMRGTP